MELINGILIFFAGAYVGVFVPIIITGDASTLIEIKDIIKRKLKSKKHN